jgi:hypothetical protein
MINIMRIGDAMMNMAGITVMVTRKSQFER